MVRKLKINLKLKKVLAYREVLGKLAIVYYLLRQRNRKKKSVGRISILFREPKPN